METEHPDLLIVDPIGGHVTSLAEEDEVVDVVPVFYNVQASVDLPTQLQQVQVATEEDGLGRLSPFRARCVDGMLHIGAAKAAQVVFGIGGAQFQREAANQTNDALPGFLRQVDPVERRRPPVS